MTYVNNFLSHHVLLSLYQIGRLSKVSHHTKHVIGSSSSRNEYYLGGIILLLLQDHRTVSMKSVCSSQYMVRDQH